GGEWVLPEAAERASVYNPALGEVIAEVPLADGNLVNAAVGAAAAAFPGWRDTPAIERAGVLFRYKTLLEAAAEEIALLISTEHGKTLAEARGDLRRGIQMVEYACGAPTLLMGESLENVARGIDCDTIRQPLGVCVGIVPFNFPAMVPLWMFPLALACGNSFVLKPSEKVPLTATRLAELLDEAGLPKGVFNVAQGGRAVVDGLLVHPDVRAISFVGSTPVARHIFDTGTQHGKRVQAAGGAKNFILIMPDATVPEAVRGLVEAAFGCAGERCMSGSTAIAIGEAGDRVLPELVGAAKSIRVGAAFRDSQAAMGPVITAAHRDRVLELIGAGEREGSKVLADGRGVRVDGAERGFYVGPTILDGVEDGMTVAREEIFGPVLNVMRSDDLEAAITAANRSAYGNGAAIFTNSGRAAREFRHRINAGMVGVNVAVPAPMAFFPFSGWNESFFGDLHLQGREGVAFYTQQKVTTSRWFGDADVWEKAG
ncbi:MAG: CoA-acylating methylmalonate-semialdehyde dehydrogenase, partial [Chthoniobacterales bacterium]